MKNLILKIIAVSALLAMSQFAQAATLAATYTVNVLTIKDAITFAGCSKVITVPPDSDVVSLYDDGTFVETVTANASTFYIYGRWSQLDGLARSKFRFNYTGNPGERTGSWGDYVNNIEAAASAACNNTTVIAYGATLRFLRGDLTVKGPSVIAGPGTGTATSSFQTEIYGYDLDYGLYAKATEKRTTSGTFVWY